MEPAKHRPTDRDDLICGGRTIKIDRRYQPGPDLTRGLVFRQLRVGMSLPERVEERMRIRRRCLHLRFRVLMTHQHRTTETWLLKQIGNSRRLSLA